jgi:hypothetical protein
MVTLFSVRLRDLEQVQQTEASPRTAAGERLPGRQRHQSLTPKNFCLIRYLKNLIVLTIQTAQIKQLCI